MNDRFESLPLFPEETSPGPLSSAQEGRGGARATSPGRSKRDPHLVAANRLARAIRRYPDYSPEQTRAGQAICRHLLALLEESEARSQSR